MGKNLQEESDEELCRLSVLGDDSAIAELIKRIMPLARAKAAMYSHSDLNTEDLVQEGMFGFMTALKTYDPNKSTAFKTYAGVCINNRILSLLRRSNSAKIIPHDIVSSIDDENANLQDYTSDPQLIFLQNEDMENLQGLIKEVLSPFEQKVLDYRLSGCSYEEISKELSVSTKSVENALGRVRRKLNENK